MNCWNCIYFSPNREAMKHVKDPTDMISWVCNAVPGASARRNHKSDELWMLKELYWCKEFEEK